MYQQEQPVYESSEQKHSRLGIASFIISLFSIMLICCGFSLSAIATNPDVANDSDPILSLIGLILLGGLGLGSLGVVLGIAGLFEKNRKLILPILGVVLNGLMLAGTLMLLLFGLLVG